MVDLSDYKPALLKAKEDFSRAEERRDRAKRDFEEAERDMVQFRRAVTALAALCGEDVDETIGITAAIRTTLRSTPGVWFPLESVRHHVESLGVVMTDRKNPNASLLSVLKRLQASGEITETTSNKRRMWTWKTSVTQHEVPTFDAPTTGDDDIPF